MAKKAKVVLNHSMTGFQGLLTDAEMQAITDAEADRIARRAGSGVLAMSNPTPNRARSSVWTETTEAMLAEARNGSLSKAVGGG